MGAQQKKKAASGTRNPNRRNGKAPKKRPGPAITPPKITPEEKAARVKAYQEKRRAFINEQHEQALAMHESEMKRIADRKAAAKREAEKEIARFKRNKRMSAAQKRREAARRANEKLKAATLV